MKQLLFLLLLSLPCLGQRPGRPAPAPSALARPVQPLPHACVEAVSGQQRTADSLLQALDKSQIPTRILYDRVAALDGFGPNAAAERGDAMGAGSSAGANTPNGVVTNR